jgi:hypothetical protein
MRRRHALASDTPDGGAQRTNWPSRIGSRVTSTPRHPQVGHSDSTNGTSRYGPNAIIISIGEVL